MYVSPVHQSVCLFIKNIDSWLSYEFPQRLCDKKIFLYVNFFPFECYIAVVMRFQHCHKCIQMLYTCYPCLLSPWSCPFSTKSSIHSCRNCRTAWIILFWGELREEWYWQSTGNRFDSGVYMSKLFVVVVTQFKYECSRS